MGMKINSLFYVSLIISNSENDVHIFNSHCTFEVRHRKIEEKCLNQTQTLQQNKINIQNRLETIFSLGSKVNLKIQTGQVLDYQY